MCDTGEGIYSIIVKSIKKNIKIFKLQYKINVIYQGKYNKARSMPVPSQEYDSSCPYVFDAFCYLILPCDYGLSELIFI